MENTFRNILAVIGVCSLASFGFKALSSGKLGNASGDSSLQPSFRAVGAGGEANYLGKTRTGLPVIITIKDKSSEFKEANVFTISRKVFDRTTCTLSTVEFPVISRDLPGVFREPTREVSFGELYTHECVPGVKLGSIMRVSAKRVEIDSTDCSDRFALVGPTPMKCDRKCNPEKLSESINATDQQPTFDVSGCTTIKMETATSIIDERPAKSQ